MLVDAVITTGPRRQRGVRAAVIDFAAAAIIVNAVICLAAGTAPGWNYEQIMTIPATGG